MTWVVSRLCQDCLDLTCLDVCPVECIVERADGPTPEWPNQLYIVPNECIDCGACEPECPWDAIFEDVSAPPEFVGDIALNKRVETVRDEFIVPQRPKSVHQPTPDEKAANRAKWISQHPAP